MEQDDWHLLKRYYKGECSPAEIANVSAASKSVAGQAAFDELLEILDPKTSAPQPLDSATAYEHFERRYADTVYGSVVSSSQKRSRITGGRITRGGPRPTSLVPRVLLGAGIAAALTLGVVTPRVWESMVSRTQPVVTHDYVTRRGQQARVTLPDGSHVVLAPATSLHFTADGHAGARVIDVDGQAFFTVASDNVRPFIVRAGQTQTRVLGTAFVVRKYTTEHVARVIVASGKVAVRSTAAGAEEATATANTLVQVNDSGKVIVTPNVAGEDVSAWTHGRVVFQNTPIAEVVAELERRYDLVIRLADSSLVNNRITASLGDETDTAMLDYLAVAIDARYLRNGRTVTFTPARRVLRQAPTRHLLDSETQYGR